MKVNYLSPLAPSFYTIFYNHVGFIYFLTEPIDSSASQWARHRCLTIGEKFVFYNLRSQVKNR